MQPNQNPITVQDLIEALKQLKPDDLVTISPYRCLVVWRDGMYFGHYNPSTQKFYPNDVGEADGTEPTN